MPSTWLETDWPAVTHQAQVDGSTMSYVDIGDGPAMVFVHGLGGSWQNWLENLPHFSRTHRCIAMDLGGFGTSEPVDGEVSIERYARSVAELMGTLGIDSAVVVGNSMGGFIALELAIRRPELVERLVLVSAAVLWQEYRHAKPLVTVANATEALAARALSEVPEWLLRRPRARSRALRFGGIRAPLPPELQRELLLTGGKRTSGFLPAFQALASYPLRDELSAVRCPTLIIWGTADPLVGVGHAKELERLIPDARASIYEGIGHVVQLEAPDRFNDEVEAFLSR
jgi:4,5:9,10-diseco-3-hydroxy-5,9,17-trioxoandrosta-1(10),2-diene-4-oate hydrolase